MTPEQLDCVAKAIYMTHWGPGKGRNPPPVWENASPAVREWVLAQALSAVREISAIAIAEGQPPPFETLF